VGTANFGEHISGSSPNDSGSRRGIFRKCNLFTLPLTSESAHQGAGHVNSTRVAIMSELAGGCNFIDYAEVPPGSSIGEHRHADDEEEFYLVLGGIGTMRVESETFTVGAGDLVRNPPGGLHGLVNTGDQIFRLFVFELTVR
jgi:mannose-6-phosphate isomerase-like protein (cupin superfamily)